MRARKSTFFIIAALILILAYIAFFGLRIPIGVYDLTIKGAPDMRFGIDIRGGVEAVFQPKDLGRVPTAEELDAARSTIEVRLDQKNILDRDVTVDKQNGYILIRFPWKSDEKEFNPQQAIAELGETAQLAFKDPDGNIILEGKNVTKSTAPLQPTQQGYVVELELDDAGAKAFDEATAKLLPTHGEISIYMDQTLISSPNVQAHITNGRAEITGSSTYAEAKALADKITAGALPFSMTTSNNSTISPTLGTGALNVMVQSGIAAFILICIFLIAYYRLPGFIACLALLMQTSGQLLALSIPQLTLTLPGIAGVILSIGMGVDANVIISERISEELRNGKPLDSAIALGFKRAFSSVFDGNITVMIVAVILMIFGSGALLSFAYSLLTGVILNFLAGVYASHAMMKSISRFEKLRGPNFYTKGRSRI